VFDNKAPDGAREDLFDLIRDTPQLDWMLLTKRLRISRRFYLYLPTGWPNVWLGATCEDQEHFDHRWPILSGVPAVARFISYEPALGPLTLGDTRPDWGDLRWREWRRRSYSVHGPGVGSLDPRRMCWS
jgi:protein gp37